MHHDGIANSGQKCTRLQDFAYTISKIFRGIPPNPHRCVPSDWTQTPISAWLTSVPIVPVLRNDQWYELAANAEKNASSFSDSCNLSYAGMLMSTYYEVSADSPDEKLWGG